MGAACGKHVNDVDNPHEKKGKIKGAKEVTQAEITELQPHPESHSKIKCKFVVNNEQYEIDSNLIIEPNLASEDEPRTLIPSTKGENLYSASVVVFVKDSSGKPKYRFCIWFIGLPKGKIDENLPHTVYGLGSSHVPNDSTTPYITIRIENLLDELEKYREPLEQLESFPCENMEATITEYDLKQHGDGSTEPLHELTLKGSINASWTQKVIAAGEGDSLENKPNGMALLSGQFILSVLEKPKTPQ